MKHLMTNPKWADAMTGRNTAEEFFLENLPGSKIPKEDIRLVFRSVREGDNESDAIMMDNKGYIESAKTMKPRMPFQPPSSEFQAIYAEGFRLAHMSVPQGDSTLVVHYWVNPESGLIKVAKIKRD